MGTDTYKKFLPKTAQDAKSIAQEIYDSKGLIYDNEAQLIAAIKKIPNAAAWQATDKQLQILTGEKGIFSYIRSFVRDNDTQTWTPILTHIAKKRLVSNNMLKLYVQYLGGPSMYPNILSDADVKKQVEDEIREIEADDDGKGNTFGGDTAIGWGIAILGSLGFMGKMFGFAGATGLIYLGRRAHKAWKTKRAAKAAGAAVRELDMTKPGMIRQQFLKLEEFITRGILGNTGSLRRMIRRLERERLITATEARTAFEFLENNRYAIASEIRKVHMRAIIAEFMKSGNKTEEVIQNILTAIPLSAPNGREMRRRYGAILRRAAERERQTLNPPRPREPRPRRGTNRPGQIGY